MDQAYFFDFSEDDHMPHNQKSGVRDEEWKGAKHDQQARLRGL